MIDVYINICNLSIYHTLPALKTFIIHYQPYYTLPALKTMQRKPTSSYNALETKYSKLLTTTDTATWLQVQSPSITR